MKYIFYFTLILLAGCIAKGEQRREAGQEKLLFLLHAHRADFRYDQASPSLARLHLSGLDPTVTYFTDRPKRRAGMMTVASFIKSWDEGENRFERNPQNAGFVFYEGKDLKYHEVNLELKKPIYDAPRNELQFDVVFLDPFKATSISDVTLFIDSQSFLFSKARMQ